LPYHDLTQLETPSFLLGCLVVPFWHPLPPHPRISSIPASKDQCLAKSLLAAQFLSFRQECFPPKNFFFDQGRPGFFLRNGIMLSSHVVEIGKIPVHGLSHNSLRALPDPSILSLLYDPRKWFLSLLPLIEVSRYGQFVAASFALALSFPGFLLEGRFSFFFIYLFS